MLLYWQTIRIVILIYNFLYYLAFFIVKNLERSLARLNISITYHAIVKAKISYHNTH